MNGQRRNEIIGDTLRRFVRRGARANISKLLGKTRPEDVALQFPRLTLSEQLEVFRILIGEYLEQAGAVLVELESPIQQDILQSLEPREIERVLDEMSVDDAVSVVDSPPDDLKEKLVEIVDRRDLAEFLRGVPGGGRSSLGRMRRSIETGRPPEPPRRARPRSSCRDSRWRSSWHHRRSPPIGLGSPVRRSPSNLRYLLRD